MKLSGYHGDLSFLRMQKSSFDFRKNGFRAKDCKSDKRKRINIVALVLLLLFLSVTETASAEDVTFQAYVDRNMIYLGQSAQLSLQFEGSTDIPAPDMSDIDGLTIRYAGPSTRMSIVNRKMTSSITHIYRLVPAKTGTFNIGPISFQHDGNSYISNKVVVEVRDSASERRGRSQQQNAPEISLKDRIFVEMEINKNTLYMNEVAWVHIKLYVNNMNIRDVQYPEYRHDGFSVEDFQRPREYNVTRQGVKYSVLDFQTRIFPTIPGEVTIGPAVIKANLLTRARSRRPTSIFGDSMFDDFFGGYESTPIELKSEPLNISVLSLPEENRPAGFKGAIGKFQLDVSVSPASVRAGDPVTLKMTVTGTGNFDAVHSPELKSPEGFKVYDPQAKLEPNRKIFEQVIIPLNEDIRKLPEVMFSYFDTDKNQYRSITKDNIPLRVTKAEKEDEITILDSALIERPLKKENIGRDIIYIKETPGKITARGNYLYKNKIFIALQLIPLILFVAATVFHRKRQKLSADLGYARRLAAPRHARKGIKQAEHYMKNNSPQDFYDAVFRTMRDYIGNRFHVPSGGITADILDSILKGRDIDDTVLIRLKNIFNECDAVRYAPTGIDDQKMNNTLTELKEIIDYLERIKD